MTKLKEFGLYSEDFRGYDEKRRNFVFGACASVLLGLGFVYIIFRIYSKSIITAEAIIIERPEAAKLVQLFSPNSNSEKENPRPFGITYKNPIPSVFKTRSTTDDIASSPSQYEPRYELRNIQEILSYNTPMKNYMNLGLSSNHDVFYDYKPQDPSDINLMATEKFRFAPPPWKNMMKSSVVQNLKGFPLKHVHFMRDASGRPVMVTLNVFSMKDRERMMLASQHQGQFSFFGKTVPNRVFR